MDKNLDIWKISKLLANLLNPYSAYSNLLQFLKDQFSADYYLMMVMNRETGQPEVRVFSPTLTERDFSSQALAEFILKSKSPIIDTIDDSMRFRSTLILPLRDENNKKETIGAIYLDRRNRQVGPFTQSDLEQIGKVANILISNLLWREEDAKKLEQLKNQVESRRLKWNMFVGNSEKMGQLYQDIEWFSRTPYTVYIYGKSGTGKELVAKALHLRSPRAGRVLVSRNCAAFSDTLIESELFGHEKGAFTGANRRRAGVFELADKGSLFLDEIGELPFSTQAKLLRVLEEQTFERVGGSQTIHVDVRLIVATNRNLESEVEKGNFREDLYFRLRRLKITVPALRERTEDILPLAHHFLELHRQVYGESPERSEEIDLPICFTEDAVHALQSFGWPGNVRQLQDVVIEAAVKHTHAASLTSEMLFPGKSTHLNSGMLNVELSGSNLEKTLENVKSYLVEQALRKNGNHISRTAKELGVHRKTLHKWLKDWKLDSHR